MLLILALALKMSLYSNLQVKQWLKIQVANVTLPGTITALNAGVVVDELTIDATPLQLQMTS